MDYILQQKKNQKKDKRNSALVTFLVSLLIFLGIFFYKFTKITEKPEQLTTMLINFGEERNGNQVEEPANQEGSLAAKADITTPEPTEEIISETKSEPKVEPLKAVAKEKVLTGSNTKVSVPKVEKAEKTTKSTTKTSPAKNTTPKKSSTKATTSNSTTGKGDGKGNAAIGNLLKGMGTKSGTQGNNGITGNEGDPLGGAGNGDSKIGIDRKLIAFIPGTMGKKGSQPNHNCESYGQITITYTVDYAGNVNKIDKFSGAGATDPCIVSTASSWMKKYVKAEKANTFSTGVYRITF